MNLVLGPQFQESIHMYQKCRSRFYLIAENKVVGVFPVIITISSFFFFPFNFINFNKFSFNLFPLLFSSFLLLVLCLLDFETLRIFWILKSFGAGSV